MPTPNPARAPAATSSATQHQNPSANRHWQAAGARGPQGQVISMGGARAANPGPTMRPGAGWTAEGTAWAGAVSCRPGPHQSHCVTIGGTRHAPEVTPPPVAAAFATASAMPMTDGDEAGSVGGGPAATPNSTPTASLSARHVPQQPGKTSYGRNQSAHPAY